MFRRSVVSRNSISTEVVKEFGAFQLLKNKEIVGLYEILFFDQKDPRKLNLLSVQSALLLKEACDYISHDLNSEARVAILTAPKGMPFSGGLNLQQLLAMGAESKDSISAQLQRQHRMIRQFQDGISALARCRVPVIGAIDKYCIGGATSIATACDIRYTTKNTVFTVKEAQVGLAADIGVLQRLPRIVGEGVARELAYTARNFNGEEALRLRFADAVFDSHDALLAGARRTAAEIAANSPLAVQGTKYMMNRRVEQEVQESLEYQATWNAYNLPCDDTAEAAKAFMEKRKPLFKEYMLDFSTPRPSS